jgi:hypothetical protein
MKRVSELEEQVVKLGKELSTATSASSSAGADAEAVVHELRASCTALSADKASLEAALRIDKADSEAKVKALVEKVNRLKALLQKGNALAQEREKEMEKLAAVQVAASARPRRFGVQARIDLPVTTGSDVLKPWCLLFQDQAKDGLRWVDEPTARQWLAEGSSLIGDWPEPEQAKFARDVALVRSSLEHERDAAVREVEEISAQFAAYKNRAQVALKRLGQDQRPQGKAASEQAGAGATGDEALQDTLAELEMKLRQTARERDAAIADLSDATARLKAAEGAAEAGEQARAQLEERLAQAEAAVQSAQSQAEEAKEAATEAMQAAAQSAALAAERAERIASSLGRRGEGPVDVTGEGEEKSGGSSSKPTGRESGSTPQRPQAPLSPSATTAKAAQANADLLDKYKKQRPTAAAGAEKETVLSVLESVLAPAGTSAGATASKADLSSALKTPTKQHLLVYKQAEQELLAAVESERRENAVMSGLLRESQREVALCEEQVRFCLCPSLICFPSPHLASHFCSDTHIQRSRS